MIDMSAATELPLECTSQWSEKTFEELCKDWLQFESSQPSTPQASYNPSSSQKGVDNESSLWLDIQQWAIPSFSPQLFLTDVQSPGSFRPYGTPLANGPSETEQQECYFSQRHQSSIILQNDGCNSLNDTQDLPESCREPEAHTQAVVENFQHQTVQPSINQSPQEASRLVPQSHKTKPVGISQKRKASVSINDPVRIRRYGDAPGRDAGILVEWGKLPQGRSKMEGDSLASYRVNRKYRACETCKKGRRKCGRRCFPYIECINTKPLVFLDRPTNIRLFRSGPAVGHPLFSELPDLYRLEDLSRSPITFSSSISQGIYVLPLHIEITEFQPHPQLKTARSYKALSRMHVLEMPRLCLASIAATRAVLQEYIEKSWYLYLQSIMLNVDSITQSVLHEAIRYTTSFQQQHASIVYRALKLLALGRMIELDWVFTCSNIPGVDVVADPHSPWFAKRPITPVIDTQLDQIIIQNFLAPLRAGLLNDLYVKMKYGKRQDWFEIFLVTFILQINVALLLKHSRKNAIQCGASHRYNSLALAEEYFHGSNILLAHFLHGGNGIAQILQLKATSVGISTGQEAFLRRLAESLHSQKTALWKLRESKHYEADLYWTHQMFLADWTPEDKTIAEP
ncbi:uncharacterized protein PV09_04465 [Verruconis gallopava]|uniref:Zn(2)-C6 fungal-type domain-containing protein n=1 Tax=Verruconis gallopava TaxID=253628 RepID=A0A0D2B034_9PEZI|nr:uncharacterized protein PV09_04465 [Verruconis gallopava]KIW04734.1 hypothetical protein PV09_04465 [Verruconis gallopava]